MKNTKLLHHSVIAGCLLGFTQVVLAAPITWVDIGNFSSENDINMTGTVVRAAHASRTGGDYAWSTNTFIVTNTYGILDFEPMGADSYASDITSPDASFVNTISGIFPRDDIYQQGGSATFDDAMDCSAYNSGKATNLQEMELVLSNLTVGVTYQVQLFRSAENGAAHGQNYVYFSDSATAFTGNYTSTNTLLGQAAYGTGQFTADATTQSVWAHQSGAVADPANIGNLKLGAGLNAYVLLQEPFILPDPLPQPSDPLLPFSITTNSVLDGVENVITFQSQLYHNYTLWGSDDLTAWVALTATNGITGIHAAEIAVTNVPAAAPYFYKVTGE